MKLSEATRARERPQRYPMEIPQPELPHTPPPLMANRANDFHECKRCQNPCGYCDELHPINDD